MSDVVLNFEKFDLLDAAIYRGVDKTVRALAFAVQAQAVENIQTQDAIDTGALRNSIYVETSNSNEREQVAALAMAAGASVGVKSGKPGDVRLATKGRKLSGDLKARVAACVEHGIYVEMGVQGSAYGDQEARPYLAPAAVTVQAKAEGAAAKFIAAEVGP